jgi:hypothetical protein
LVETRPVADVAREHKAAVTLDARHLRHRHCWIIRIEIAWIAVIERHGFQPAVQMIGPAVIAARKLGRVALLGRDHERPAMGALVVNNANRAVDITNHHDRLATETRREVVAGIPDLAFVADVDPCDAEDALHLQLEDLRVGVQPAVNAPRLNERREVL